MKKFKLKIIKVKCTFCHGTGKRIIESRLENFGNMVATLRIENGMTQGDLAQKMGYTRTSITNIEAGRQDLPIHKVYEIAGILGVEAKDLL